MRMKEFFENVEVLKIAAYKIRQLDEINEKKIKPIVEFNAGRIDSAQYKKDMDSLKALEDRLHEKESSLN